MMRECTQCQRPFAPQDFVKEESKNMESERKALGLEGVRFLYYTCPRCNRDAIFLDLHYLDGETPEAFSLRRAELEAAVRQVHAEHIGVVITERKPAPEP
jgi:hypothetical protein